MADEKTKPTRTVPGPDAGPPEPEDPPDPNAGTGHAQPEPDEPDQGILVVPKPPQEEKPGQEFLPPAKRAAARQDQSVYCVDTTHSLRKVSGAGAFNVYVEGQLMAREGDGTTCKSTKDGPVPGTITSGEGSVSVRGAKAARDYDTISHGGYVVPTESKVHIGPPLTDQELLALAIALLKAGPYGQTPGGQDAVRALAEAQKGGDISFYPLHPTEGDSYVDDDGHVYVNKGRNEPENVANRLKDPGRELGKRARGKQA